MQFYILDYVNGKFDSLEDEFSKEAICKLSSLISCSEYGLTEIELLEILMPTNNSEDIIRIEDANFNFSSLCAVRTKLGKFTVELVLHLYMYIPVELYRVDHLLIASTTP